MRGPTKNLDPISSAVLTFIGYKQRNKQRKKETKKQTNKETNKQKDTQTDKQSIYFDNFTVRGRNLF